MSTQARSCWSMAAVTNPAVPPSYAGPSFSPQRSAIDWTTSGRSLSQRCPAAPLERARWRTSVGIAKGADTYEMVLSAQAWPARIIHTLYDQDQSKRSNHDRSTTGVRLTPTSLRSISSHNRSPSIRSMCGVVEVAALRAGALNLPRVTRIARSAPTAEASR